MEDKLKYIIDSLKSKGVQYADARYVHLINEKIEVKNGRVDVFSRGESEGFGIRVLWNGSWGFAASSVMTDEEVEMIANQAILVAKASARTQREPVILSEEKPYVDTYTTKVEIDPFSVSIDEKISLLLKANERLRKDERIRVATANMDFSKTEKIFINSESAFIKQTIFESGGGICAIAIGENDMQKRSYPNSFGGDFATKGYEFIEAMDLVGNAERVADEAIQLLKAKECPCGRTTLIIGGPQLALQVHESCGHPVELDRVLGMEASFAGTSFLTLDKLGKFKYGSKIVNIVQDATTPGALACFGYDDEGVKATKTDIVREGIFVGYLMSRETASRLGKKSNGTMRAESWNGLPIIRMTSINLEPGDWTFEELIKDTKDGIYVDINKSWSIDDKRLNFQFGAELAREIKNGKLGQVFKNPIYTGITPEFWNSCDAICNKDYYHIWGLPNCGKGEPMQTMNVSHGTAPARFRNVEVGVKK